MNLREEALELHRAHQGKLAVASKVKVSNAKELSLAYSPGVAEPCSEIAKDAELTYEYTSRGNMVAVVSDGTAVLGLGDIGPEAALPVMEGKAILFKNFSDIDAFPICLATKEVDEIVQAVKWLEPTFGGVNLEDISGPRCFEVEAKLKAALQIPVFHDDQHGTAVVCLAALLNALKLVGKELATARIVINGAGAAGISIAKLLMAAGATPELMKLCDREGILAPGSLNINADQAEIAVITNAIGVAGNLAEAMVGTDVLIGVSAGNIVNSAMVASMAREGIIFALANPVPEIMPEVALTAGAVVVGTGRSDYPNQVNNVLGFPGIFRGTLDVRAREINETMKLAAARAIAGLVEDLELAPEYIIPSPFDRRVVSAVALAVAQAAMDTEVARTPKTLLELEEGLRKRGLL